MTWRRRFLIPLVVVAGFASTAALDGRAAATAEGARAFIRALGDDTVAVLADTELADEARIGALYRIFRRGFDVPTISFFALGRYRRQASREQLREYVDLFGDLIVRTYAARIGTYQGETLEILGTREATNGDIVVSSEIVRPNRTRLRIAWRVRERNGTYKVIDVVVEGISMVITQRDEFAAVIRSGGGKFEGLLAALREKAGSQ